MKTYFKILFIYKNIEIYTLWYSNDADGLLNENNKINYFSTDNELIKYSIDKGIEIEPDEITIYNIDDIQKIIRNDGDTFDCEKVLNFWNIIADIAKTIDILFLGNNDETTRIYDKLFYGNNLPTMRGNNEMYTPSWNKEDIAVILKVLEEGCKIFELSYKGY